LSADCWSPVRLFGSGVFCSGTTAVTHARVHSLASCRTLRPSYLSHSPAWSACQKPPLLICSKNSVAQSSLRTFGVYSEYKDTTERDGCRMFCTGDCRVRVVAGGTCVRPFHAQRLSEAWSLLSVRGGK
jgi:hypothetical protein